MSRLHIATRGLGNWRERLADPERQWRRTYSAFETAVSWELAARNASGLPASIGGLFERHGLSGSELMFAVAEHKVDLPGGRAASQCDVWAVVRTSLGSLSLTVEAKAKEPFGDQNLITWLEGNKSDASIGNRKLRWDFLRSNLPAPADYMLVRYQLLHRCAAAVIEARRLGFKQAAFVVQAFCTPDISFSEFARFCDALSIRSARDEMASTTVRDISLHIGWVDCPLATDADVAATA